MEHELGGLLDGVDEPVTVEELEGVVRRAGQRRRATLMAGAAGLLLCGAVGGALARGPVRDHQTGLAADRPASSPTTTIYRGAVTTPAFGAASTGQTITPLFRRVSNAVAIRAYRLSLTGYPLPQDPLCAPPKTLVQAEFSNAAAVAIAVAPELAGDTLAVLATGVFGRDEGETAKWAIVRAGARVATVRVTSGAAGDTMAPQDGVAVLALNGGLADTGVVEGLAADGVVLSTQPLAEPVPPAPDPACFPTPCVEGPDSHVTGPATTVPANTDPATPPPAPAFPPTTVPGPTATAQAPPTSATTAHPPDTSPVAPGSSGDPVVTQRKPACGSVRFSEGGTVPPKPGLAPGTSVAPRAALEATTSTAPPTTPAPPPSTASSPAPSLGR